MKTIILSKTNDGWMAETLIDGKPDAQLVDLFGSHILPTAFTAAAKSDLVLSEIKKRNPGATIKLSIQLAGV